MWIFNTLLFKTTCIVFITAFFCGKETYAQDFFTFNTPTPSLSLSLGSHEISIGFHFDFGLQIPYTNFTLQNATRYYFKAPGNEKKGFESRFEAGVNLGQTPKKDSLRINFGSSPWHFKNQLGYAYIYYWDQFGTSQANGIFRLKVNSFHFQIENDFFAFQDEDRYRTGAFYMGLQIKENWFYIKNLGYTGDPYAEGVPKIEGTDFQSKWGYMDMSKAPLGDRSLGVISAGWASKSFNNYQIAVEVGIDAEQIRNFFQNILIHDSKWLQNPHIPMLDTEYMPYIYLAEQSIRKPKPYLQIFLNDFFLY